MVRRVERRVKEGVKRGNYQRKEEVSETGWWKLNQGKFNMTKEERRRGRKEWKKKKRKEGSRQGREEHSGMQGRRPTEALTQSWSVPRRVHVPPPLDVKRPTPRQLHRV